jgi:hypothetical protein
VHDDAPPDPFAGDPNDPAAALGDQADEATPLGPAERDDVLADLADLEVFRALLEPLGVRGLTVDCGDCGKTHYIDWELLHGNLRNLLDEGMPRVHEPALSPDPIDYVSWEYARGYVDGVIDSEEGKGDE